MAKRIQQKPRKQRSLRGMARHGLSILMAMVMVISLIQISAFAGEFGPGGAQVIEYHMTDADVSKLLVGKDTDYTVDDIEKITLVFYEDYILSGKEFELNDRDGYFATTGFTMVGQEVDYEDVACLKFEFTDGSSLEVAQEELTFTWYDDVVGFYEVSLTNAPDLKTVTFYYQWGGNLHWDVYQTVLVEEGTSLGDKMPEEPSWLSYQFINWEVGSHDGGGANFTADTVVNEDIDVYARKITIGGGTAYHVMNRNADGSAGLLETEVLEQYPDATEVEIEKISVLGQDGEQTNPDYFTNGWKDNEDYYYIYNVMAFALDSTPQYQNTSISKDDITGIWLSGTVNGEHFEYTIPVDQLEFGAVSNVGTTDVIIEIRLKQDQGGQEPDPDPEYDLPVKYYVLNPKQGVPENGDDQGYLNYFPFATAEENKDFNYANGMSGTGLSNATWTALAGDGALKIDDTLTNMDGFSAGQVGQLDSKSIAALEDAFGLTSNTYEIVWYAVKCQAAQGTSGLDDDGQAADIHVDGYIKDVTVDVRYHANFKDASPEVYSDDAVTGEVYSVLGYEATKLPDRDKYEFVGWNTQPDGKGTSYPANSEIDPVMGAVDLYAQWESKETPGEKTFSVNFQYVTNVANASQVPSGVSLPAALTAKVGETITFDQQPYGTGIIPDGYTFHGWYSDAACSTEVTEDQTFAANATVYGYWTYTSGGGGGGTTYYTLTVKYLEDGTDEELAPAYTQSIAAGRSYDVTAQTQKTIDGYDISKVTGDDVSGFMSGNREIIVYYTVNIDDGETPLDPGPGGDGSGDGDTDIGDGEVPLDPGTGNGGDGTDIGDENVPLVPATGDNLALWVLAAVVSAAGLVYLTVTGKKREQENG